MAEHLPEKYVDLLQKKAFANLGTLNPDGSPQVTPVWVDYDGKYVRINSARGRVKDKKNIRRDPRVSLSIQDPENPTVTWRFAARWSKSRRRAPTSTSTSRQEISGQGHLSLAKARRDASVIQDRAAEIQRAGVI